MVWMSRGEIIIPSSGSFVCVCVCPCGGLGGWGEGVWGGTGEARGEMSLRSVAWKWSYTAQLLTA